MVIAAGVKLKLSIFTSAPEGFSAAGAALTPVSLAKANSTSTANEITSDTLFIEVLPFRDGCAVFAQPLLQSGINDCQCVPPTHIIHICDSQQRAQLFSRDFHRSRRRCSSRWRLRESEPGECGADLLHRDGLPELGAGRPVINSTAFLALSLLGSCRPTTLTARGD